MLHANTQCKKKILALHCKFCFNVICTLVIKMYNNFLTADHSYRLNCVFVLEIPVKAGRVWCLGSLYPQNFLESHTRNTRMQNYLLFQIIDNKAIYHYTMQSSNSQIFISLNIIWGYLLKMQVPRHYSPEYWLNKLYFVLNKHPRVF